MFDALRSNKFNVLHWHVVDDNSWPLVSQKYPLFSEKGAFSPREVYNAADAATIIKHANDRGIIVKQLRLLWLLRSEFFARTDSARVRDACSRCVSSHFCSSTTDRCCAVLCRAAFGTLAIRRLSPIAVVIHPVQHELLVNPLLILAGGQTLLDPTGAVEPYLAGLFVRLLFAMPTLTLLRCLG